MISARAWRIGSAEMRIRPEKGESRSRIIVMPPETAIEQRHKAAIAVPLAGANRPKLAKTIASQEISRIRNGNGMLLPPCSAQQPTRLR